MANSLGTIGVNVIAREAIAHLAATYPFIGQLSTDFSNETAQFNSSIISTIPSVGAAEDYNAGGSNGYVNQVGVTGNNVSVTLNKHKVKSFTFTPNELASTNLDIVDKYAKAAADSLGLAVMGDLCALFVTGTFTNSTVTGLAGANVNSIIVDPNTALSLRKVPKDRFGIFAPDYYGALFKDDQVISIDRGGNGVSAAQLPVIRGVSLSEFADLPSTSNLKGVIGHKSAVVFASRIAPTYASASKVSIATHEKLGISVLVREWEDPNMGNYNMSISLMYGVAVADATRAQLIRSA